ncbi:MAG: DUF4192 domain-containing protein [Corynebacterium sp.]|uniref:DUF4192 domain-containing protein n=1 Tax=Corynebacterium sp. TaxID=1720 RepID=UPI0026E0F415|nr:DUF4192 domain-containing protein [Corynebacterium sp.]MDO5669477.1 DUF4192 domain-containing protein [Corynebacterium sp.]
MTTPSLASPGQIAANLPGILGFYPNESLVFVTFTATDEPHQFSLGPVLRIDLDDFHVLNDLAETLHSMEPALVMGFIITTRPDEEICELIDTLILYRHMVDLPLDAAWVTPRILTGEVLTLGLAEEKLLDSSWARDVIAPVTAAQSMQPLLAQGELPELSREEMDAHFAHGNRFFTAQDCEQFTDFAVERAWDLCPSTYPALVDDARLLIDEARDLPLTTLMGDEEVLLTVGTLLGTKELRDLVAEDLLCDPVTGSLLMLAVARTFHGEIRHNALCLYALCSVELQLFMRATHALLTACAEDPAHVLAGLLFPAAQHGQFRLMVSSVREGSLIVRSHHGINEPPAVLEQGTAA